MIIGILGGGQLSQMIAHAGQPLNYRFIVLDPTEGVCANSVAEQIVANYDDKTALDQLAERCDIITYEFENVPVETAEYLAEKIELFPAPAALKYGQDRLVEKNLLKELGIATAPFAEVNCVKTLQEAVNNIGLPAILKTRRDGYDGKGQVRIKEDTDLQQAWDELQGAPCILEGMIPFCREVSIIAVRSKTGALAFYPIAENVHKEGILRLSTVRSGDAMQSLAEDYAKRLLEKLDYVGTIAIEFFQVGDKLLANEYAPRVHNSGHWTQDGADVCQFENHLRAGLGLPLGNTESHDHVAMVNFIGLIPDNHQALSVENSFVHMYGKEPRPGRKVGHINIKSADEQQFNQAIDTLMALAKN